tara:strand:- start:7 stop:249 length:243 start_codon:yes stop_codon:yes gene_type:complete
MEKLQAYYYSLTGEFKDPMLAAHGTREVIFESFSKSAVAFEKECEKDSYEYKKLKITKAKKVIEFQFQMDEALEGAKNDE